MLAHQDNGAFKARIITMGHGDKQLAAKRVQNFDIFGYHDDRSNESLWGRARVPSLKSDLDLDAKQSSRKRATRCSSRET